MQAHIFVFPIYILWVYVQFLQPGTMVRLYLANILIRKMAHEIYYEGKCNTGFLGGSAVEECLPKQETQETQV